jgi:hypothetical protein
VTDAQAAGYEAVISFNEGNPGRTDLFIGTLGSPFTIPVVGLSFADASALYAQLQAGQTVVVRVLTESEIDPTRTTRNIIADSPTGSDDRVVGRRRPPRLGDCRAGHQRQRQRLLDHPRDRRGDGRARHQEPPEGALRLLGAEELSLLGSEHYVNTLSDEEVGNIVANLNFDMLGSPNYVRFAYDGDSSAGGPVGPPGSGQIEDIFNRYFASQGLATDPIPFDGRSDYGPFIAVGIPAGGLFSGAEGEKTPEQAAIYGGTAGEPYDPCYHEACDDITNLSTKALFELGDAAAHAVMTLARSRTGLFEDGSFCTRARAGVSAKRLPYSGPQAAA